MQIKIPYIHYMNYARHALILSGILTVLCLLLMIFRGFNFGLDFTGGATIELQYTEAADIPDVRKTVNQILPEATVLQYGSARDVQIRFADDGRGSIDNLMQEVVTTIKARYPDVKINGQSKIGGQYKSELIEKGITALVLSCVGLVIYLAVRFEMKFAIGAVLSQLHDVIATAAMFSLAGWTMDLTVLAALLAVLGYSVNDTVVVYDRIRENFLKTPHKTAKEVINDSINQTMARTIVTGLTTALAVISLLLFGGSTLFGFSAAMLVGIVFGSYSSIFVASAIALKLGVSPQDLMPKEKAPLDDLP